MAQFKIGDIIKYGMLNNVRVSGIDEKYYYLTDRAECIKPIYKSLVEKHGTLITKGED